jgi:prophage regulatory protein
MSEVVAALPDKRIYKLSDLIAIYSMSRSSIYRAMAEDDFPKPIKLTSRSIGWWREQVEEWFASRPAGIAPCADNEQYQSLGYLTSRPGSQRDAA